MRPTVPRRNNGFGKGPSQGFLAGPSENCRGLRIPISHDPRRIDTDHPVKRGIDDGSISFLTLEQRGFSGFCPGIFLLRLSMLCARHAA